MALGALRPPVHPVCDLTARASALRSKVMVAQNRAFLDDPDDAAARRWWLARY